MKSKHKHRFVQVCVSLFIVVMLACGIGAGYVQYVKLYYYMFGYYKSWILLTDHSLQTVSEDEDCRYVMEHFLPKNALVLGYAFPDEPLMENPGIIRQYPDDLPLCVLGPSLFRPYMLTLEISSRVTLEPCLPFAFAADTDTNRYCVKATGASREVVCTGIQSIESILAAVPESDGFGCRAKDETQTDVSHLLE